MRKPGHIVKPGLGQVPIGKAKRPIRIADLELNKARHATCVEHIKVDGLREPICVPRGADREALIREARALSGLPQ